MKRLFNPYPQSCERHYVTARVSIEDFAYLKTRYPIVTGLTDKILSNLFSQLINRLREYECYNGPIEPAWSTDHPSFDILDSILGTSAGRPAGTSSGRDDAPATSGVCEAVCNATLFIPDPQGSSGEGGRSGEETKEEGQRGPSSGPSSEAGAVDPKAQKKLDNIEKANAMLRNLGL